MSEKGERRSLLSGTVGFFLENRLVAAVLLALTLAGGLFVAPFDHDLGLPRSPVPVDAIPDIGENQQIVFTEWAGRSPQDVEDQVTYPLTVALLGVPGVKTIRSNSYFGYSSVYVVFEEGIEFYWSRSRVLEKLASLPPRTLPEGVRPALGPDATALGQVFWYTLEGEGFSLHELRSVQDFTVRYALLSAGGVAEVASVGGYVREYQVDVDPDALRAHGVTLGQVFDAVRRSNVDVGARTIEVNRVEYLVRGVGFLRSPGDLERTVIVSRDNVPLTIGQVAHVSLGPATRRGALDREGAEAVGGVVVVRHGENPLRVIENVKAKIAEIAPGLPRRTLEDGRLSQVTIVPFYDRTQLIQETLGTLQEALSHEILITALVVIVMLLNLRAALLVSGLLPLAVLLAFLAMRLAGVDANLMSLSGIAIAIGTMVDMGIVVTENVVSHLERAGPGESRLEAVRRGASEVAGAVLTAAGTTVVSFLPVFALLGPEGKLFRPLAFTKTFALAGSALVAIVFIPPLAYLLFGRDLLRGRRRVVVAALTVAAGLLAALRLSWLLGLGVILLGLYPLLAGRVSEAWRRRVSRAGNTLAALAVGVVLTRAWLPLGPGRGLPRNLLFVALVVGGLLLLFFLFRRAYEPLLRFFLRRKALFAALPLVVVLAGGCVWLGFESVLDPAARVLAVVGVKPEALKGARLWQAGRHAFPGLGKEFMPPLDEGSFLLMPTTMPHASLGEALDQMQTMDMALRAIPEVESVVGKLGRVESPLDPAPVSMFETVINYRSEYRRDPATGRRVLDEDGRPVRQWRDHIRSPEDIWEEIVEAARLPGVTSAPRLQPIAARLVMLQSGMRAPLGVKVQGQSLEEIEALGFEIERLLKEVPGIRPETVVADRVVGKPYLEIAIDRDAIARYGVNVRDVQDVIEIAVGGKTITRTVEGRERYPVRVRYQRELRDSIESLGRIIVPAPDGSQVPLEQLAEVRYTRGPMVIKSEDTFLVGYVLFDKEPSLSEVEVVEAAREHLAARVAEGRLRLPEGASYVFAGSYENQVRSERTLALLLPLVLVVIFLLLYLQFRRASTAALVFSGVLVAWAGGFLLLGLYGTGWFLDLSLLGVNLRELFQVHPVNLSVAVWVGFIALFGIATDDGVLMGTYLEQSFSRRPPRTREEAREATVRAALRRVRPCLLTAGTTLLALLPVIASTGRGSDVMVPMALPVFGGMTVVLLTLFVVPVFYCALRERGLPGAGKEGLRSD